MGYYARNNNGAMLCHQKMMRKMMCKIYVRHTIMASHSYCWSKKKVAMMRRVTLRFDVYVCGTLLYDWVLAVVISSGALLSRWDLCRRGRRTAGEVQCCAYARVARSGQMALKMDSENRRRPLFAGNVFLTSGLCCFSVSCWRPRLDKVVSNHVQTPRAEYYYGAKWKCKELQCFFAPSATN